MPGTIKIWWHDGAVKDVRYNELPVVNEPEIGFTSISTAGATPVTSQPAPDEATVAIVETDVSVRYVVRRPGGAAVAHQLNSKPIAATGFGTDSIGVSVGDTISFVEV